MGELVVPEADTLSRRSGDQRRDEDRPHVHGHAAFVVGTLHGLAGSSHLVGILPALALSSDFTAGTYLLFFGTGSVAAMGTFASLVGWIAGSPGASSVRAQATLLASCSVAAVAVGGFWIFSDLGFIPRTGLMRSRNGGRGEPGNSADGEQPGRAASPYRRECAAASSGS